MALFPVDSDMEKSQIDKLMELKQLYEQGILTKEEMEAEKHKILGKINEVPKTEMAHTHEQQAQIVREEPSKDSYQEADKPFFDKYKYYIIGGVLASLLAIGWYTYWRRRARRLCAPFCFSLSF